MEFSNLVFPDLFDTPLLFLLQLDCHPTLSCFFFFFLSFVGFHFLLEWAFIYLFYFAG